MVKPHTDIIFSATWETLTERIAIMEIDGGLDHRAAILKATKTNYPADYAEMERLAKEKGLDPETSIYEFIEELMTKKEKEARKRAIEGPGKALAGQGVQIQAKAQDKPLQGRETQPIKTREGPEALAYMTGKGIALIGAYESGATIAKGESWATAFTTDMKIIDALRAGEDSRAKGRITRFYFLPERAGFLCLDIDRKNGKDGIEEFYSWAERAGKPRHLLPRFLQDIPANFPCYVETPSGGLHLYFSYSGGRVQKKPLAPETPGVEVKHGAPGLTSPGSYKNGCPYILHGDLENAPQLPAFILAAIEPPKPRAAAYIPQPQAKKEWGKPSWDKVREWTEADGAGAGRNDRAFNLARHARNHGYTEAETLAAMRGEQYLDGLPEKEIETAVHSAFTRGKTA
jgi:hypothetical protein